MSNINTGTDCKFFKRKVKIFDVEKKELLKECESLVEAEEFTGVKNVGKYIKDKIKSYKN